MDIKAMIAEIERGNVSTVIVKDMSRFGRDYLKVGFYTEVMFREKGVRFIAISNGVDSDNQENSDFTPFLNVMNEFYCRDTSRKIQAIFQSKMKEGKRVSPSVPYGYLHDPNDKHKLIVDEVAAKTVRQIFQMAIEGKSLGKIADTLCEEKVLIPSAYWWEHHPDHAHTKVYQDKYRWSSTAVSYIINKREYMGHTILGKSKSLSYKTKKRVPVPLDEQLVFENTHSPIVSEEIWNTAHRLRKTVRRPSKTGEPPHRLTGILYCADCGSKMTKRGGIRNKFDSDNCYICSKYRQYNHDCSMHYVKISVVEKLILDIITRVSDYVKNNEKEYLEKVREVTNTYKENRIQDNKKQLNKGKKRITELDALVKKLYETFASGKLPENHFERLLAEYDTEQRE